MLEIGCHKNSKLKKMLFASLSEPIRVLVYFIHIKRTNGNFDINNGKFVEFTLRFKQTYLIWQILFC